MTAALLLAAASVAALLAALAPSVAASAAAPQTLAGINTWSMVTVPLPAKDIAYDPTRDVLLVTVRQTHPSLGNSLVELDPESGAVLREVWIGTSLDEVAVTDDGSTAYVGNGPTVAVVDLEDFVVVDRFEVVPGSPTGLTADDLVVLPGRNDLVVASLRGDFSPSNAGLRAYVDGIALPDMLTGSFSPDRIEATSENTLYGFAQYSGFPLNYQLEVTDAGLTANGPIGGGHAGPISYGADIQFALGRIYTTTGQIVDPVTRGVLATFPAPGDTRISVTDDGRLTVFDLSVDTITVRDASTGAAIESRIFNGLPDAWAVEASATGFAVASDQGVTLIGPQARGDGFVAPPVPPSSLHDGLLRTELPFRVNDLVFDASRGRLYASVAATSQSRPNQLLALRPGTGEVLQQVNLAGDPGPMAMSADGSTLLVALRSPASVASVALDSFTSTGSFSLGTFEGESVVPYDLELRPGTTDQLIVATDRFLGLYTAGVRRPLVVTFGERDRAIEAVDATTLYGVAISLMHRFSISDDGVEWVSDHYRSGAGYDPSLILRDGLLYTSQVEVLDPSGPVHVGRLDQQGPIAIDEPGGRLFVADVNTADGIVEVERATMRVLGNTPWRVAGDPTDLVVTGSGDDFGLAVSFRFGTEGRLLLLTEDPGRFHPVTPARIVDTRFGVGAPATPLDQFTERQIDVTGVGGVPDGGVSAVVVNVTAVGATAPSHLTVWPTQGGKPQTSNVNFGAGQVVANQAIVPVGIDGRISIANAAGLVHVVVDVQGWFGEDGHGGGAHLHTLQPARLVDSRLGLGVPSGRIPGGGTRQVQVTGMGGVPASGVSAVVVNLTVVGATTPSYLTVWPAGSPQPRTSNLNFRAAQVVANQVIVPVGAGGRINIANSAGATHVVVDVQGWFGASGETGGLALTTVRPARIGDTRSGSGLPAGRMPAGAVGNLLVTSVGGVPPVGASAVILNITAVGASLPSYLTVWPNGAVKPATSNVNFAAGQVVANQAILPVGTNGQVRITNAAGAVHVIVDVQGWFGPPDG